MNLLFTFAIILYVIVCVLLILLVLIQGGKAEGLFSSAQANVLGSQSANVLQKATSVLATIFIAGALFISVAISTQRTAFDTVDDTATQNTTQQTTTPVEQQQAVPALPSEAVTNN